MNRYRVFGLAFGALTLACGFAAEVLERGPHHAVYQSMVSSQEGGAENQITNRWTLLQPGLNYFDSDVNAWVPSTEQIELTDTGAIYRRGPFSVRFAANAADANGAIHLTLPDGKLIDLQTVGIAITDSASGDSVWIGELKDSNGFLDGNKVLYPDAFSGIKADIQTTVSIGRFESDVIIRERSPVDPTTLGMNLETCRLEIWHHILHAPQPAIAASQIMRANGASDSDQQVDFGSMVIGQGNAFLLGLDSSTVIQSGTPPASANPSQGTLESTIPVAKELFQDGGSENYLIESVPLAEAMRFLNGLPVYNGAAVERKAKSILDAINSPKRQMAQAHKRRMPSALAAKEEPKPEKPAQIKKVASIQKLPLPKLPGFLMDYAVLVSASDFTFKQGSTYYVTNAVLLSGNTVIEGNSITKFSPVSGSPSITVIGSIDCKTGPYSPAIFTAETDNTVGDTINTNAPSGQYAATALIIPSSNTNIITLHDLRVNYAQTALSLRGSGRTVQSIQISSSGDGINAQNGTANVCNYLAVDVANAFSGSSSGVIQVEQATLHRVGKAFNGSSPSALSLTNSLLVVITNSSTFTSTAVTTLASDTGIFQTVGAGAHYLAALSPYRNKGANSSAQTKALLQRTTTYAPSTLSSVVIATATILEPQAVRDLDTPDLGYHYSPIDFMVDSVSVTNATLTLTNGVSLAGYFGTGIYIFKNGTLVSEGTPFNPNEISRYTCVQEQPLAIGGGLAVSLCGYQYNAGDATVAKLRFTEFNGGGYHIYQGSAYQFTTLSVRDAIFRAGQVRIAALSDGSTRSAFTNNVFDGVITTCTGTNLGYFYNNLLRNGLISISNSGATTALTLKDNAFDQLTIISANNTINSNNAYLNYTSGPTRLTPTNAADLVVSSFNYTNSTLGGYYQLSKDLVNKGSRTAAAATLFHHTTQQDESPESGTQVDIGFHYVSTACSVTNTVWVDESWPADAVPFESPYASGTWNWVSSNPISFSAQNAYQSTNYSGDHQAYFTNATYTLPVATGDKLVAYVYLDTTNTPTEIMLQWKDAVDTWEHRAYWGANDIAWGTDGTASRKHIGSLPTAGQWTRLEVAASDVGLEGRTLLGLAFTMHNGRSTWDAAGKAGGNHCYDSDGDGIPDYLEDINGNGLTDSGETGYLTADTDGDGMNDGMEVSLGLNPFVNQFGSGSARKDFGYDLLNRVTSSSGNTVGTFTVDKEGNVK